MEVPSGLVEIPKEPRGIAIAVAMNGFFCYDKVFEIAAASGTVTTTPNSWGAIKARFE